MKIDLPQNPDQEEAEAALDTLLMEARELGGPLPTLADDVFENLELLSEHIAAKRDGRLPASTQHAPSAAADPFQRIAVLNRECETISGCLRYQYRHLQQPKQPALDYTNATGTIASLEAYLDKLNCLKKGKLAQWAFDNQQTAKNEVKQETMSEPQSTQEPTGKAPTLTERCIAARAGKPLPEKAKAPTLTEKCLAERKNAKAK